MDFTRIDQEDQLPLWSQRQELIRFFHETMEPWNDSTEDISSALDYLFSAAEGKGGFLLLHEHEGKIGAALAMLATGMGGYVPAHILLFVSVSPDLRGQGIGGKIVREALEHCSGPVKLHVEYDNPAKRLYERLGFTTRYAEMRYDPNKPGPLDS